MFIMWVSLGLLLSWVLKDGLAESAKNEVAALTAARTTFYLRADSLRFGDEIAAHINTEEPAAVHRTQEQLEAELRKQLTEDFRASMVSNHLDDAVDRLSHDVEDLKEAERTRVDAFYSENLARANKFKAINETLERHAVTDQDLQAARQLASDASYLDYQMIDLGTLFADRVDKQLSRAETKEVWYSRLTYASTFLLWCAVFVGRHADIDVPGPV